MRTWTLLLTISLLVALPGTAATDVPVGRFESVELHSGGHVVIRQGARQRVTILSGDTRVARISVDGPRLIIRNNREHRRQEKLLIEIVTPELLAVAVANGGTLEAAGTFRAQSVIAASVEQGGTIDIRAIPADAVAAAVHSGGRIYTQPRETLAAAVRSGGVITYWGRPTVTRSIRNGGVIAKGSPANIDKPLSDLGAAPNAPPPLPALPPVPPVPPLPPVP